MKTDGNDAAFARPTSESPTEITSETDGLTKREYFAAIAMDGLCSKTSWDAWEIAAEAVKQADALIAALSKEGDKS